MILGISLLTTRCLLLGGSARHRLRSLGGIVHVSSPLRVACLADGLPHSLLNSALTTPLVVVHVALATIGKSQTTLNRLLLLVVVAHVLVLTRRHHVDLLLGLAHFVVDAPAKLLPLLKPHRLLLGHVLVDGLHQDRLLLLLRHEHHRLVVVAYRGLKISWVRGGEGSGLTLSVSLLLRAGV